MDRYKTRNSLRKAEPKELTDNQRALIRADLVH